MTAGRVWKMAFESAAVAGVEPWTFSLKELMWMADAVVEHEWNIGASIQAVIAEVNRDKKHRPRPFTMADFHPVHVARKRRDIVPMEELKSLFTDGKVSPALRERM